MKQKWMYIIFPALFLLGAFVYLLIAGGREAAAVQQKVVRFHVVGASDTTEDQTIKLKVRDGVFALIEQLFADCTDQEQALAAARENADVLQAEAERILRQEGSDQSVAVEVGTRFFPTKSYGTFSFPAGRYQAVSIRLGAAEGENFWCVLYPALCIAPAVEQEAAEAEMAAVLGEERCAFLQKSDPGLEMKFALAEWWGHFVNFFVNF